MGRLLEHELPFGEFSGLLWKMIKEDTLVWGTPTEEEKRAKRAIRAKVFRESAVPWILQDLTSILGFYDDVQDIVSFATWNKKIFWPPPWTTERVVVPGADITRRRGLFGGFSRCMKGQALEGRTGAAAISRCMCPLPRGDRKRRMRRMGAWDLFLLGPLTVALLKFFPPFAPVMYLLLAGQVAGSLLGYGIKLGPIMGASMELFYRGLEAVGLPFGREHNKWYQLKIARTLKNSEKGFGAAHLVDWEDRLTGIKGVQLAWRDGAALPEFVMKPGDYPTFDDLWDDPLGAVGNLFKVMGSLAPNMAAYLANDFFQPLWQDIVRLATGEEAAEIPADVNPFLHAALRVAHSHDCPDWNMCQKAMEDAVAMEEWAMSQGYDIGMEQRWWKLQEIWNQWVYWKGLPEDKRPRPGPELFPDIPY